MRAITVAVRCPVTRIAISPTVSPGPRVCATLTVVAQRLGRPLLHEVDQVAVLAGADQLGTRLDLDLPDHRGELRELSRRKLGECL